ncbi:DNA mismatch repair endonuclease MutL [Peribacillus alkalitolerans]|uniref:DNA mismatch repair endonuclease MutL n=1 Tax=Peribacillus alkalitolerans TaxID=1550385 RepID=UPI0013CFA601|nr:DNA mismatch repair endonuclease MutL [Peribacillus alkalitolerans]
MGKIIQLDDSLSNKIAAGEVVERPASVVKELVENSIDAKSTIIEVFIEEAGLESIRIVDNGEGIEEDDVLKAFDRHATSKIKDENDLFRIRTLGFRGEALPSIASVSLIDVKSSTGNSAGVHLQMEGGKVLNHGKTTARKGTDIKVANLFFNTPARLKYVKTVHTELGNISDTMNRLALSHPEISFKLAHHDKVLLQTNGNGDVRQVMSAIYGMAVAKKMVKIEGTSLDFTVEGYISLPEITRASRNYLSIMINGRFIKNYALTKAVLEGYHTLLPIGRFPIGLISISMDPILVDVNVHPSKMEVRLSKESELNDLVLSLIKDAFSKQSLIPSQRSIVEKLIKPKSEQPSFDLSNENHVSTMKVGQKQPFIDYIPQMEDKFESKVFEDVYKEIEIEDQVFQLSEPEEILVEKKSSQEDETITSSRVPPLYYIGQMHGTYIMAQNENGLYIIDQHAAQERLKYEYYKEKVGKVENNLQELFVPLTLYYSSDEVIKINEHSNELEKVGVFLEEFGNNAFLVRSHPQWFPTGIEQEIIEEMIQQLLQMKKVDVKKLREEAAILMSCKASIKANHYLTNHEIQVLLDDLRACSDPFTCPHGRPIIVHFTTYEMEKMFKRVM